jgi:hypothetical protein
MLLMTVVVKQVYNSEMGTIASSTTISLTSTSLTARPTLVPSSTRNCLSFSLQEAV